MKTAIQTPPATTRLVTIEQYTATRAAAIRLNSEQEGKRIYQIILSLVLDNPFSLEAKVSFPVIEHSFDLPNLTAWAFQLRKAWLPNLSRRDLNLFYSLKFQA